MRRFCTSFELVFGGSSEEGVFDVADGGGGEFLDEFADFSGVGLGVDGAFESFWN